MGLANPQSAGQSCQSMPAAAARWAAMASPRASRSCPCRKPELALALGAATAPAMSVAVTSAPAEPSAATRLFRLISLKWDLPLRPCDW